MKKLKGLMTSETNEWYTPKDFYNKLNKEFNFTLDPCCTKESAKCEKFYTIEDDGLSKDWKNEIVFMNPPYGREIRDWIKKAHNEHLKNEITIVCLIPARTDTSYWHDYIFNKASEIRFLKGRIKFERPDGSKGDSAPFPSAVIVYKTKEKKNEI